MERQGQVERERKMKGLGQGKGELRLEMLHQERLVAALKLVLAKEQHLCMLYLHSLPGQNDSCTNAVDCCTQGTVKPPCEVCKFANGQL